MNYRGNRLRSFSEKFSTKVYNRWMQASFLASLVSRRCVADVRPCKFNETFTWSHLTSLAEAKEEADEDRPNSCEKAIVMAAIRREFSVTCSLNEP